MGQSAPPTPMDFADIFDCVYKGVISKLGTLYVTLIFLGFIEIYNMPKLETKRRRKLYRGEIPHSQKRAKRVRQERV